MRLRRRQRVSPEQMIEKIRKLHRPFGVYDDCGHSHAEGDPGVMDIYEVGLVCAEGLMYEVCNECCAGGGWTFGQTEDCATSHGHGKNKPICATTAILEGK